jgi:hypothetical protein
MANIRQKEHSDKKISELVSISEVLMESIGRSFIVL